MYIKTTPLPGFGMEISGVDLSQPFDDRIMREILQVFHTHGLIVIGNQNLDFDQYDNLTMQFGNQRPHFLDHLRHANHPAILNLSNIFEDGKPIGVFEGAAFWHTDVAYEDPPNSSTIVYGRQWPKEGCHTYFADQMAAYDGLSESIQKIVDELVVLHHYGNRADLNENSKTSAEKLTVDQKNRVANVYHPLVKRHPVTGRKALYGVAGSSFGIIGMPNDEAFDLLNELAAHAIKPAYVTSYDFRVGDAGAWDTFSTLHKATVLKPATGPEDSRLLWRISVTGLPPSIETELAASA
jgi:taurine dioxygenase